jgi:predicted RND superfamily exporter protein
MGFAGLPVDIHTLLLAPIALGVVTDDTAHFMHSVKQRLAASGDVEDALGHTLSHVGRSIVINGATLTAGFGVYLAASMQSMQRLAILVVLTIALSLLADLVFTPALIRIAFRGAQRAGT